MDHILILMDASTFADARGAVISAVSHADNPDGLSFGFTLQEEPAGESAETLNALRANWLLRTGEDLWASMERFWGGEDYVLLAHPAMRFAPGWDAKLLQALSMCRPRQLATCALTGCLPTASDLLHEVCPVGAGAFESDGTLTLQQGMPLRHVKAPVRSPFLHPDFCFAPAGFFRAMTRSEEPLFMQAFRKDWEIYTLHDPVIELQWNLPAPPVFIPADHDLCADFQQLFGVDFARKKLSGRARRGLMSETIVRPRRYPVALRIREWWRHLDHRIRNFSFLQSHADQVSPRCITLFMGETDDETLLWFRQLVELKNVSLTAYVPTVLKRLVMDFVPETCDLHQQHFITLPGQSLEAMAPISKPSLLAAARDHLLDPSHYVWIDPDCIRYPVYQKAYLDWEAICGSEIVMAMVNGQPDTTMFSVPQERAHDLADAFRANALRIFSERGTIPTEAELWSCVIIDNPDWFSFINMPACGLLYTLLSDA